MNRTALLALCLLAGGARAQAVAPLAPPVAEPAPTSPAPGYTPAGAGASHGGLAAPSPEALPTSTGRVLRRDPKFGGPELWSAEDEPRAGVNKRPAVLCGVEVPFPFGARTEAEKRDTRQCSSTLGDVVRDLGLSERVAALTPEERTCLVARLMKFCTSKKRADSKSKFENDTSKAPKRFILRVKADDTAAGFEVKHCTGIELSAEALQIYSTTAPEWGRRNEGFDGWEAN